MLNEKLAININNSILEYKQAYENIGIIDLPPYRITCKEHKILAEYCSKFMIKPKSMLAEYYGVRIEVVMIVDPYL